jgi:hypothetical protein
MAPNTICLKGDFVRKEGEANGAITPGHLVEFGSGVGNVEVQSVLGQKCRHAFALENDLVGKDFDDDYAAGDTVSYGVFAPGAEVYALLDGAENVSVGDALSAGGDGSLVAADSDEHVVAFALEDVNNSAESTGGAHARIIVEVA